MKLYIYILTIVSTFSCTQYNTENNNTTSLSFFEYYPNHERPKFLYHGVDKFILDEVELIICLLEIRENAIVNNYSLSVLSSQYNSLFYNKKNRFQLLRSIDIGRQIVEKNIKVFNHLKHHNLIGYLIDYNFSDSTNLNYYGGEGYLPLPKNQISNYNLEANKINTPYIESEPNELIYNLTNFPKYYRYSIYTSEHFKTAALFGKIVLKIKDKYKRGLSLGRYAQYKYGHDILLNENCISFNGATNTDEYVFPGIIFSKEIIEAYIIDNFIKRGYTSTVKRTYKKTLIGNAPVVNCIDQYGRILFQVVRKDGIIKYKEFHDANGSPKPIAEISSILEGLDEYNTLISQQ